jgi:hypothetical protein
LTTWAPAYAKTAASDKTITVVAERQQLVIADETAHHTRSRIETLIDWGLLIKRPHRLLQGMRIRGRRSWLASQYRRLTWVVRSWANHGVCSIELDTHDGFFAHMTLCLYILRYCEYRRFIPDIRFSSDNYRDLHKAPNWLNNYFDQTGSVTFEQVAKKVRYTKRIANVEDMEHLFHIKMSLEEGARTLNSHLRAKPHIIERVEDLWRTLDVDGPVVGVHFRGTDKILEAPRVSWDHVRRVVQSYLQEHNDTQAMFVASDQQQFVEFLLDSIKNVPIYFNNDHYRSKDDRPIHKSLSVSEYEKGEDALNNALLLAKCSTLIRTTSSLSAWASVFNPRIKVILLNKPYYPWFPESEILMRPDTEYFPEYAI